jgi:hypothetical protein
MSDTDSVADFISDSTDANAYSDDGDEDYSISRAFRVLCNQLRVNDPRVLAHDSFFVPFPSIPGCSEGEQIKVFRALEENTGVKNIRLWTHTFTKSSAEAAAEYLESS